MYLLCVYSGCKDKAYGPILKELMQTTNFRVTVVGESDVVEICGALKVDPLWFPRPKQQRFNSEFLFSLQEHRRCRSWFLWRPGLRRQHQGGGDPSRPDGDDRLRQVLLHQGPRLARHLPGELRHRRPHHDLLRRTQPQDREGIRRNRQSTTVSIRLFVHNLEGSWGGGGCQ